MSPLSPINTVESVYGGWDYFSPPKEEDKPKRRTVLKSILKNRRRPKAKAVAIAKEDANADQCNFNFQEMQEAMLVAIIKPLAEDAAIVNSALQNICMMESTSKVDAISRDKTISSKSTRPKATIDTKSDDKSVSLRSSWSGRTGDMIQQIWKMSKSAAAIDANGDDKTVSSTSSWSGYSEDTTKQSGSINIPDQWKSTEVKSIDAPSKIQKMTLSKGLRREEEATKSAVKRKSNSNQKNNKQATDASAKSKSVSPSRRSKINTKAAAISVKRRSVSPTRKLERKVSSRTMIVGLK